MTVSSCDAALSRDAREASIPDGKATIKAPEDWLAKLHRSDSTQPGTSDDQQKAVGEQEKEHSPPAGESANNTSTARGERKVRLPPKVFRESSITPTQRKCKYP